MNGVCTSVIGASTDWEQADAAYKSDDISIIDGLLMKRPWRSCASGACRAPCGRMVDGYGRIVKGLPPPILRLAEQLHEVLPTVLANHTLKMFWAHHYDSELNGNCPAC